MLTRHERLIRSIGCDLSASSEQARTLLRYRACAALELGEQSGEQCLALLHVALVMLRTYPGERLAEALLVERLQQIVHRAHLEGLERVGVIAGHEHDRRQMLRLQRAREVDAVQRVHLNVEEQQLRPLGADFLERGLAVGVLADHREVPLGLAEFTQHSTARRFVIDDDDVH